MQFTKTKKEIYGTNLVTTELIFKKLETLGAIVLISETVVKIEPIIDVMF